MIAYGPPAFVLTVMGIWLIATLIGNATQRRQPTTSNSVIGWQPDPYRRHQLRYFDGMQWRHDVCDSGVVAVDDPDVAPPPPNSSLPLSPINQASRSLVSTSPPMGWSADPYARHSERWFNGNTWSSRVRDGRKISKDPVPNSISAGSVSA